MMEAPSDRDHLLVPEHNCWRIESADRLSFLIDAAAYFRAFSDAVKRARESVLIIGWDIHGGTRLLRRDDDESDVLGSLLHDVVSRRSNLNIHVLEWDFSMLFALERDWTPLFGTASWIEHPRLHFRFDDNHPVGASHHQKIVVVDDVVAFLGGIDLTERRWDTPEHRADEEKRRDTNGEPYGPVHDVQIVLEGNAASALGELARERWSYATGETLSPPGKADVDPWPESVTPDIENVAVAIARTMPESGAGTTAREVEQLYVDIIASARRTLYIENQYFTSRTVFEAIERRLREPDGPEILMVLPRDCPGWLEESTMGLLRARLLERLQSADEHGRFRACFPVTSPNRPILVHSKVLIADDRIARVGSSNLSNRSMGLDTECDVAIEAPGDDGVAEAIASFRNRLLAEHLGTEESSIESTLEARGTLAAVFDRFAGKDRTLRPIHPDVKEWDALVPDDTIVDPDEPEVPKRIVEEFVTEDVRETTRNPWIRILVVLGVLLGLAAAWRWTPLQEWIEPESLARWADELRGHPFTPFTVTAVYVVSSLIMLPITGLILVTALTFDPWPAIGYSLLGSVIAGVAGFAIGHVLARDTVRQLAGPRLNRVSKLLGRGGIVAVIALRILPVAPFTIVNIIAGASHIRWRNFTLGTALGLAPGILAINLFKTQAERAIQEPGPASVLFLGVVVVLIVLGISWARRTLESLAGDES